ncbi:hypothetical protein FHS04_001244 [Mesoflavibacter sabulilitoris]|uniref:Uncharacterized protein n=1 Tax=Mesoflavibacter zeaxanthinifaciens subsp. sabulilitoris TaxID=1520893 RepID=A0A2T1NAI4_9FLAO|nr:hypothetical protein [Mesoflavibacter zeaxanthinifaciens]MBB3123741.1 hypothetical protein [Mesoflavibacter zeaxanthinifaciens subsp. sabulilitoris]PSG89138.1 hypothetical protein C7H61_09275 [Mesoflavibacter zeaxanthinifaciens subsp. sabulilitoris]
MIGNLYTEEEVKQLLKDVLHTDQTDIERFYYPDGTTSGFDQDEFNTWFDKHKKPENSQLEAITLVFKNYNSNFNNDLIKAKDKVVKINGVDYLMDSISQSDAISMGTITVIYKKRY